MPVWIYFSVLKIPAYMFFTTLYLRRCRPGSAADNAGKNNNNVSLVCRYDDTDETWYEFSIANNGLYWIYAYDDGYNLIANGGSNLIRPVEIPTSILQAVSGMCCLCSSMDRKFVPFKIRPIG